MNISALDLKARLDQTKDFRLVDVREPDEWVVAKIPGAELIPLSQFQHLALERLSPEDKIVLYCHHGVRSARAQDYLKSQGYNDVINLSGGIDAWSIQVDPTIPRY